MKKILYGLIVVALLVSMVACTSSKSDETEDDREESNHREETEDDRKESDESDVKTLNYLTSAYNQAYQENYEPDSLEYILENASNSYVILDFSGEDLSEDIEKLQANNNEVSAYISIGTGEKWREDFAELKPFLTSIPWDEWEEEYFVNNTKTGIVAVMKRRIDQIADMGFDWVEFDNMDWAFDDENRDEYEFRVTAEESIEYYTVLCEYAHEKGLKCMAKNLAVDVDSFDGATYESYSDEKSWWDDEDELIAFVNKGKVVLINHYGETDSDEVYEYYTDIYGDSILFISEDENTEMYKHYTIK